MGRLKDLRQLRGPSYLVKTADDDTALASVLGMLLEQNLDKFPERVEQARAVHRSIAVVSVDTDEAVTLTFSADHVLIESGVGDHGVAVHATVDQILDVAQLRVMGILPVGFASRRGMRLVAQLVKGRLRINGLLRRPFDVLRFIALVSVIEN